ncbi:MAG: 5'-nucleotidase [Rikenellaceae bacterium]
MLRQFFALLAIFILTPSLEAMAQRDICVKVEGLFAFDPLSGWYIEESLEPVSTYIKAWREEALDMKLVVTDSLRWGYRHYLGEVDTTLMGRVLSYLGAELRGGVDSAFVDSLKYRDLSLFPKDKEFTEFFNSDIEAIKRYFATPLVSFDTVLRYDPYEYADFEALFHTFQREASGADFSIFSPSRLDAAITEQCFIRNIVSVLYYDNDLVVVEMSGRELKEYMEEAYSKKFYRVQKVSDDLLRYKVPAFLFTSLSGVSHTVNLTKPRGKVVENWTLEDSQIYRVAMNSFLARDLKIVEICGDYKALLIRWLREVEEPLRCRVEADLQPQRIIKEIRKREEISIIEQL